MEEQSREFRVHLNSNSFLLHKQNLQKKLDKYEEDFARTIKDISERQKLLSCSLSSESEHSAPSTSTSTDSLAYGIGEGSRNVKTRKISKSESFERTSQSSTRSAISLQGERRSDILPTKAWSFPSRASSTNNRQLNNTDENLNDKILHRQKRTLRRQKRVERIDIPSDLSQYQRSNARLDKISVANFASDQKDKLQITFTAKSQHEYQNDMSTEPGQRSTQAGLREENDINKPHEEYLFKNKIHMPSLLRPANFPPTTNLQDQNFNNNANIKSVDDISRTVLERPVNARLSRSLQSLSPISEKEKVVLGPVRRYTFNGDSEENESAIPPFEKQVIKALKKDQYLPQCHRNAWSTDTNEKDFNKSNLNIDSGRKTLTRNQDSKERKKSNGSSASKGFLQHSNGKIDTKIAKKEVTNDQKYSNDKNPRRKHSGKLNIAGNEEVGTYEKNRQRSGSVKEETRSLNSSKDTAGNANTNTGCDNYLHKTELRPSKATSRKKSIVRKQGNNIIQNEPNSSGAARPSIQSFDSCDKYTESEIREKTAGNERTLYNKRSLLRKNSGERNITGNQKGSIAIKKYDNDVFLNNVDEITKSSGRHYEDKQELDAPNNDSKTIKDSDFGDNKTSNTDPSYQVLGTDNDKIYSSIKIKGEGKKVEETTSNVDQQLANQREGQRQIILTNEIKVQKPEEVVNSQTIIVNQLQGQNGNGSEGNKEERPQENLPRSKGWRKLQAIPLARIQQLQTTGEEHKKQTLKDFEDKSSNAGPGLLSFRQVVLAAIKRKQEEKAEAERKRQLLSKERMIAIQQPTESFLRQSFDKAVHHGHERRPPPHRTQGGVQFRTVVRSLQSFRDLSETVNSNRAKRAERIRKKSNVTLPYTRKLELLSQENKSVGEMMKDVEDCRYLRNKKSL